jgi:hypothetical protein
MSEPDAVPLPREGEVFFDVRGAARSLRLSWYADSKVAVFSIWQAERCTGTFRLPFCDLARMVQTLTHGPQPQAGGTARPALPAMTGQQSYDADGYQAAYRAAASEPATSAYRSADLPGYPGYSELPGYSDIPGYDAVPDYADLPGYGAPATSYGPAAGYSPVAGYGPAAGYSTVAGSGAGTGYDTAADAAGPGYGATAASDVPRYLDLPGTSGLPGYPDQPAHADRPDSPNLASHPYQPGYRYAGEPDRAQTDRAHADRAHADRAQADRAHADRAQADRAQADRIQAARALSAAASQGEWLAAPAVTSGWDSAMQEPSATEGLMSFPSVPARNGPAAPDSGHASGY